MLYLNYDNLAKISAEHGLNKQEILDKENLIESFLQKINSRNQGFYTSINDPEPITLINDFTKNIKDKFKYIVVLGIGGSALGAQAIKYALIDESLKNPYPKLLFLSNIDPNSVRKLELSIKLRKTLFVVVSKSGSTIETLTHYLYFRKKCELKKLPAKEHFVFITDKEDGTLRMIANRENINTFDIPKNIGGRFSVLTPVGLLPAKLAGVQIEKIIIGAKKIAEKFTSQDLKENIPFTLATIQYLLLKKGKNINILMPYCDRLKYFSLWFIQLLAESIGKKGKGITPISAMGAFDQHSQLQLFLDGPNDKLITFIELENLGEPLIIPNPHKDMPEFEILNKKVTFNKLFKFEKKGTEESLTQNNIPNITLIVDRLDEESLGEMFMLFMTATAFLGEYLEINAFDQPAVEQGKKITKELLIKEYS